VKHENASSNFCLKFADVDKVLPVIFAIPKLHKNPYKFRFIAGARKSSMKPLSLLLTKILTFLKEHFRNYCFAAENFSGSKWYWSVDSSLATLQKIKSTRKAKTITKADFSTLYTSLPHKLVLDEMWSLIHLLFGNSKKEFLCVGYKNCFYANQPVEKCYTCEEVCDLVQMIMENTFVTFSGFTFRQISGIPMGGNASPLLADLTLAMLEFKFLKKASVQERREIGNCSRYIDDILNLNGKNFMETCKKIYPACLPLEETTSSEKESNFLDLTIRLEDKIISTTLYNKTDAFNFAVIRLPESSSNLHSNIGYNTFYSQLIRIARICTYPVDFEHNVDVLCNAFINKGFSKEKMSHMAKRFSCTYSNLVFNLGYNRSRIMEVFKRLL